MTQPISGSGVEDSILSRISEGMEVYDSDDQHVGRVTRIYLGDVGEGGIAESTGPATAADPDLPGPSAIVEAIADIFNPGDDLPEVVRARLVRQGFIEVEGTGLLASDRYVMPDQIQRVASERVYLKAARSDLIK